MADLKRRTRPKRSRDWSNWKLVSSVEYRMGWSREKALHGSLSEDTMGPQVGRRPVAMVY